MRPPSYELIDRLAAEYVLGTLRGPARTRFSRWLVSSAQSAHPLAEAAVRRWENRLVHLADDVRPVDPAPSVWREIERRTRAARTSPRASSWHGWALAASVLIVVFSAWVYFADRASEPQWQIAAQLRDAARDDALWRIEFDARSSTLRVTAQRPQRLPANETYELWALADGGVAPISLGLLPQRDFVEVRLNARQSAAFAAASKLAVSREPSGGSPTGTPTGPVIAIAPRAPLA